MVLGRMSAKGVGEMAFINGTMNACEDTKILADKMTPKMKNVRISLQKCVQLW